MGIATGLSPMWTIMLQSVWPVGKLLSLRTSTTSRRSVSQCQSKANVGAGHCDCTRTGARAASGATRTATVFVCCRCGLPMPKERADGSTWNRSRTFPSTCTGCSNVRSFPAKWTSTRASIRLPQVNASSVRSNSPIPASVGYAMTPSPCTNTESIARGWSAIWASDRWRSKGKVMKSISPKKPSENPIFLFNPFE